jgi:hypothetical protein
MGQCQTNHYVMDGCCADNSPGVHAVLPVGQPTGDESSSSITAGKQQQDDVPLQKFQFTLPVYQRQAGNSRPSARRRTSLDAITSSDSDSSSRNVPKRVNKKMNSAYIKMLKHAKVVNLYDEKENVGAFMVSEQI